MKPPGPAIRAPHFAGNGDRPRRALHRRVLAKWRHLLHKRERRMAKKQIEEEQG